MTMVPPEKNRPQLLGLTYDTVTFSESIHRIEQALSSQTVLRIITVNLNFLTIALHEPDFAKVVAGTGLSVVDGRILQWLTWIHGDAAPSHITGHDLFHACVKLAHEKHLCIFLLGGELGVASELARRLETEHSGLRAVGTHHGMFTRDGHCENQEALLSQIRQVAPDFLFVALGAPKQDAWLANHQESLGVPVGVGIGGVFDVEVGRIPRAPRWMQKAGLESLFQLFVAPRRYLKRYLWDDIPTLALALISALHHRFVSSSKSKI